MKSTIIALSIFTIISLVLGLVSNCHLLIGTSGGLFIYTLSYIVRNYKSKKAKKKIEE